MSKKGRTKMKKKDEMKVDLGLEQLGVYPLIYHFETAVSPFTAITIAEDAYCFESVRTRLDHILSFVLPACPHEKATKLREELVHEQIFGVAICDPRDQLNRQRGRTIAKGRLLKHHELLRKEQEKREQIERNGTQR